MINKMCFEVLDRTLKDLLRFTNKESWLQSFRGKLIVLGGDFCQILPVIPNATRQQIVFYS